MYLTDSGRNISKEIKEKTGLRTYVSGSYTDERVGITIYKMESSLHSIDIQILIPTAKSKDHKRVSITRIERWFEISGSGWMAMACEITDKTKRTNMKQTDELRKVISIVKKYI